MKNPFSMWERAESTLLTSKLSKYDDDYFVMEIRSWNDRIFLTIPFKKL